MKYLKAFLILIISFSVLSVYSQSFDLAWETEAILKTPESVYYDEVRDQIYVSNINGKPTEKDNNGFISILSRDGSIKTLKWVTGMHAPKGMTMIDSLLYVTDIDRFHIIDVTKNRIIKTVDVEGAKFLNDMANFSSGEVYISDMANNQVLKYDDDSIQIWLSGDEINSPNGLAYFRGFLYVGVKDALLKVEPVERKIKVYASETGPIDGLIPLGGGKFVISDWSGRIMKISSTEKVVLQNTTEKKIQAADLGYIPDEKLVLIPTFFDNRVVARRLP